MKSYKKLFWTKDWKYPVTNESQTLTYMRSWNKKTFFLLIFLCFFLPCNLFNEKSFRILGNECVKQKEWNKALEYYNLAIENNPKDEKAISNRSLMYIKLKEFSKALIDAERCFQMKPKWYHYLKKIVFRHYQCICLVYDIFYEGYLQYSHAI